jgi:hypothetical protein
VDSRKPAEPWGAPAPRRAVRWRLAAICLVLLAIPATLAFVDLPWAVRADEGPYIAKLAIIGIVLLLSVTAIRQRASAVILQTALWGGIILTWCLVTGFATNCATLASGYWRS